MAITPVHIRTPLPKCAWRKLNEGMDITPGPFREHFILDDHAPEMIKLKATLARPVLGSSGSLVVQDEIQVAVDMAAPGSESLSMPDFTMGDWDKEADDEFERSSTEAEVRLAREQAEIALKPHQEEVLSRMATLYEALLQPLIDRVESLITEAESIDYKEEYASLFGGEAAYSPNRPAGDGIGLATSRSITDD